MANGYPEVEEQESTRIEKVLLTALVAFLLVGGFWALSRIESAFPSPELQTYQYDYGYAYPTGEDRQGSSVEDDLGITSIRSEVKKIEGVLSNRRAALDKAQAAQQEVAEKYEFRREEYRTAMQSGRVTAAQQSSYESARAAYQRAKAKIPPLQAAYDDVSKRLNDRRRVLSAEAERARDVYESRLLQRNVRMFAYHFGFAAACLGLSWILWQFGRSRQWRYQTVLTAFFTASVLQLIFLLFRYCWELFLENYAALGVSVLGSVVCILAIIAIKRWLFSPQRLAEARLALRCCPMCSTPFIDSQTHCWHCGTALVEQCNVCGGNRLLYAPHCGNCGRGPQAAQN
jgi:hypothetical protein